MVGAMETPGTNRRARALGVLARASGRTWRALGVLGIVLVCLEGAARILVPKPTPPSFPLFADEPGRPATQLQEEYFSELVAAMRLPWEPYVYWRLPAFTGTHIQIDADGFRRTWNPGRVPPASADPDPEVWMLGGSALWGIGARDDHTIASLVSRNLAQRGTPATVRNLAVVGYVSTQEIWTLIKQLKRGGRPRVVVLYNGSNDVLSTYFNRRAGATLLEPSLEENRLRTLARRSGLARLTRHWLFYAGSDLLRAEPLPADRFRRLVDQTVGVYASNVDLARRLGDSHGFRLLVAPQPLAFFKPQRHSDEELGLKRDDFVSIGGYDVDAPGAELGDFYLAAYDSLAAQFVDDSAYCDLRSLFKADAAPRFIDYCHTTEAANGRIAAALTDKVADLLAPP